MIKEFVTSLDVYGTPILLTFNKKTKFKSFIGGITTIIFRLAVFAYFTYLVSNIYTRLTVI